MSLSLRALSTLALLASPALGQTWQRLDHDGANGSSLPLLLTDGTVLVHRASTRIWRKLTPDAFGSYLHGTWAPIAQMPVGYEPLYFASAVLADGRVVVIGGEYNSGSAVWTNLGAIYDPTTDVSIIARSPISRRPPARVPPASCGPLFGSPSSERPSSPPATPRGRARKARRRPRKGS